MKRPRLLSLLLFLVCLPATAAASVDPKWTTSIRPFQIADNLYYVGGGDLAAYLVTTPAGNILINANYTSSPPQIRHSVEQLGFRWADTKILLISHAHVDHAGGAAQIRKETGAKLEVMDRDVDVMESGGKTDFAFGGRDKGMQFPPAPVDHVLHDGAQVSLGGVTLTAHKTPGHTKGCPSWTLQAHIPGEPATTLRQVVIVGSWSVLPSYRLLTKTGDRPASYPGIADDYARTFSTLNALPCDVFLGAHGQFFHMLEKRTEMQKQGDHVWIDPDGYRHAVAEGQAAYEEAYRREASVKGGNARP